LVEKLLDGIEVRLDTNYLENKAYWDGETKKVLFTGSIDSYYNYCFGPLEYRSLKFEFEHLETENYQGAAVINYTSDQIPYTRIIEHKHFDRENTQNYTVITREYPASWKKGDEAYYPINDEKNTRIYREYAEKGSRESRIIFGGRLGLYQYMDMDQVLVKALALAETEKKSR
jgi:UDP-galactopyranose mutase